MRQILLSMLAVLLTGPASKAQEQVEVMAPERAYISLASKGFIESFREITNVMDRIENELSATTESTKTKKQKITERRKQKLSSELKDVKETLATHLRSIKVLSESFRRRSYVSKDGRMADEMAGYLISYEDLQVEFLLIVKTNKNDMDGEDFLKAIQEARRHAITLLGRLALSMKVGFEGFSLDPQDKSVLETFHNDLLGLFISEVVKVRNLGQGQEDKAFSSSLIKQIEAAEGQLISVTRPEKFGVTCHDLLGDGKSGEG